MMKSWTLRSAIVVVGVVGLLAILRFQFQNQERSSRGHEPQVSGPSALEHPREELTVGFLPVT